MNMKKILAIALVLCMLFALSGCGKTKTLHCDNCDKKVKVDEDSNMTEDWIIYCDECNEKLFGDDPLLGAK